MFRKYSDTAIIQGIHLQDEKVLKWVYNNYLETVRHLILRNSGSEADVSDIFQETIIVLYRQITEGELNLTSDLRAYFFGIAKNLWNAQLRRKSRLVELVPDVNDVPENEDVDDQILERIVSKAFQKLKPDAKKVLTLYAEGMSYDEIAKEMNLKNETYARRKKYLSKETLIDLMKQDPEYKDYLNLR